MRCSKCGAELSEDTKFCSYCGNKVEMPPKQETVSEEDIPPISLDEQVKDFQNQKEPPKSLADRMREKASAKWGKLSTYGKIATVAIAVFALLFIVALLSGKTAAIIIAVLQIALSVVAVLMHRGIIKIEQKKVWLKWLLLGIAALLTVLNVMSYSWGTANKNKPTPNQTADTSIAAVSVAAPYGAAECLEQDYTTIQAAFYAAGFTNIEAEKVEDLQATDVDKVNTIDAISVGGKTDFTKEQEFQSDDEVLIRYHGYAKCNVKIHVDFVPNLIFSKYDVNLLLNGIEEGTLTHGEDQDFEFSIDPGEYTLTFESAESSSVKGEVTLTVDCDIEASYKIACSSDKVSVETLYVDRLMELADGEVKLDVAASEYKHKNYEDVAAALKTLGFTNIKYEVLYDIVLGWTDDGEVESVSIADKTDFNRGDVFPADAEIVITYHMPEDDDPSNITMAKGSDAYDGMNYVDVEQAFRDMGFTNIELGEVTTESTSHTDGEVMLVEIDGWSFDAGDSFKPDEKVYIKYYHIEELEIVESITIENNSDFAALMQITDQTDAATIKQFVNTHIGDVIEFDGCIAFMMNHNNYKTRFDVCMAGGDYEGRVYGPLFAFEDVNYYDMNVSGSDSVSQGMLFRIAAEIVGFSDAGNYVILKPVSLVAR